MATEDLEMKQKPIRGIFQTTKDSARTKKKTVGFKKYQVAEKTWNNSQKRKHSIITDNLVWWREVAATSSWRQKEDASWKWQNLIKQPNEVNAKVRCNSYPYEITWKKNKVFVWGNKVLMEYRKNYRHRRSGNTYIIALTWRTFESFTTRIKHSIQIDFIKCIDNFFSNKLRSMIVILKQNHHRKLEIVRSNEERVPMLKLWENLWKKWFWVMQTGVSERVQNLGIGCFLSAQLFCAGDRQWLT